MLLAVGLLAGCGKKGPLVPPGALVPAPVTSLAARQQGDGVRIAWNGPVTEAGGRPLRDLSGFILQRHTMLPPGEDCQACPESWQPVGTFELNYLRDLQRSGSRYLYRDTAVKQGEGYRYRVTATSGRGGVGRPALTDPVRVVLPPLPPALEAVPSPTGITLLLVAIPLPGSEHLGFNIYRWRAGEPAPFEPVNRTPVAGPSYVDERLEPGVVYHYTVTSLVSLDGQTVESAPSNEAEAALAPPEFR